MRHLDFFVYSFVAMGRFYQSDYVTTHRGKNFIFTSTLCILLGSFLVSLIAVWIFLGVHDVRNTDISFINALPDFLAEPLYLQRIMQLMPGFILALLAVFYDGYKSGRYRRVPAVNVVFWKDVTRSKIVWLTLTVNLLFHGITFNWTFVPSQMELELYGDTNIISFMFLQLLYLLRIWLSPILVLCLFLHEKSGGRIAWNSKVVLTSSLLYLLFMQLLYIAMQFSGLLFMNFFMLFFDELHIGAWYLLQAVFLLIVLQYIISAGTILFFSPVTAFVRQKKKETDQQLLDEI